MKFRLKVAGVDFDDGGDPSYFADLHFELLQRRPPATPRRVHFSKELHTSLGLLQSESLEAWRSVFYVRGLLVQGKDVTSFLSKRLSKPFSELSQTDGLLLDFGMHHFHLSRTLRPGHRFRERTKHLLFAMIRDRDTYFVDIRTHCPPAWSSQDLLAIVHSNWPELLQEHAPKGQTGDRITDEQRAELRRKNVNAITQLGTVTVAPLGGGMTMAGTSATCRYRGDELLHEIGKHQDCFDSDPPELRAKLPTLPPSPGTALRLRPLPSLQVSPKDLAVFMDPRCFSKRLVELGFVVVEDHTGRPVALSLSE